MSSRIVGIERGQVDQIGERFGSGSCGGAACCASAFSAATGRSGVMRKYSGSRAQLAAPAGTGPLRSSCNATILREWVGSRQASARGPLRRRRRRLRGAPSARGSLPPPGASDAVGGGAGGGAAAAGSAAGSRFCVRAGEEVRRAAGRHRGHCAGRRPDRRAAGQGHHHRSGDESAAARRCRPARTRSSPRGRDVAPDVPSMSGSEIAYCSHAKLIASPSAPGRAVRPMRCT